MILQKSEVTIDDATGPKLRLSSAAAKQPELLEGLPFYDWSIRHSVAKWITTFNNVIDLLQKNGQPFPLFDYEHMLFNELRRHKQVWIKKATGLGITEFMLRYRHGSAFVIQK